MTQGTLQFQQAEPNGVRPFAKMAAWQGQPSGMIHAELARPQEIDGALEGAVLPEVVQEALVLLRLAALPDPMFSSWVIGIVVILVDGANALAQVDDGHGRGERTR
ncbi:MAG: hypothetical protein DMG38_11930 [Acidobacteria bacterium]|nr:MAG: hypothetical protein DMG38_11930 [Acidobacteriota bacterium]